MNRKYLFIAVLAATGLGNSLNAMQSQPTWRDRWQQFWRPVGRVERVPQYPAFKEFKEFDVEFPGQTPRALKYPFIPGNDEFEKERNYKDIYYFARRPHPFPRYYTPTTDDIRDLDNRVGKSLNIAEDWQKNIDASQHRPVPRVQKPFVDDYVRDLRNYRTNELPRVYRRPSAYDMWNMPE